MTKKVYEENDINDIGLALQEVFDTTDKYYVSEMGDAIRNVGAIADKIINNSISELKTAVENIPAYKFYQATQLQTVEALNCKEIGDSAFYGAATNNGLNTIKLSDSAIGSNEVMVFNSACLAIATGAIDNAAASTLKWIDIDDEHYIGMSDYFESDEVIVYDPYFYIDEQTLTPEPGNIIVTDTGEPYIYSPSGYWREYTPTKTATVKANALHSTKVRNLGFKIGADSNGILGLRHSHILFVVFDKDFGTTLQGVCYQMDDLRAVFYETAEGGKTDILPFEEIGVQSVSGSFANCTNLKRINIPYAKTVKGYAFTGSGLTTISLPALETLGHTSTGPFQGCTDLETVYLGDGTKAISFGGSTVYGHFNGCTSLYLLQLNSTSLITLSGTNQTMAKILSGTPLINFIGTTTTEITEGSTVTSLTINGSTVTAVNGNITTYGGKDWQLVNGAWTEWGTDGSKHPVIKVPNDQITSYQSDTRWGVLNSEIWQAI